MLQKFVVMGGAWLELVGASFVVALPNLPCVLLFAVKPEGIAIPLARFAGFGLLGLGIACLPSKSTGLGAAAW